MSLSQLFVTDYNKVIVDTVSKAVPEFSQLYAEKVSGVTVSYPVLTAAPTVGFRELNCSMTNTNGTYTRKTFDLKYLDATVAVDKQAIDMAVAQGQSAEEVILEQESFNLNAGMSAVMDAVYYGGAFTALKNVEGVEVVDNGGTVNACASETGLTSVYVMHSGTYGFGLVAGKDAKFDSGDSFMSTSGGHNALIKPLAAWIGYKLPDAKCVKVIANIDDSTHKIDDDSILALVAKFPVSRKPNAIILNSRSLEQLRRSRTATNMTGAPAPIPTDVAGIPILVSEVIVNDEEQYS